MAFPAWPKGGNMTSHHLLAIEPIQLVERDVKLAGVGMDTCRRHPDVAGARVLHSETLILEGAAKHRDIAAGKA